MVFSTIKKKKCKCGCDKFPTLGFDGYFYNHAPQDIKDRQGGKAKVSHQAKLNRAKKSSLSRKLHEVQNEDSNYLSGKGGAELQRWFLDRRKGMTGKCSHCGKPSCKHDDKYFKFSICHILQKAYFPSIATHPKNFIELCFWNNSCHSQMDNKMLDLIDMACWDEIITKFVAMYPSIAPNEKRRIPQVLMQYIDVEK
jgi:hypothetical protein